MRRVRLLLVVVPRRSFVAQSEGSALKKKKLGSLEFIFQWEVERRMQPFGRLSWDTLSTEMVDSWGAASAASKGDVLSKIHADLKDSGAVAPPALKKGEVYAFSAAVDEKGQFSPSAPSASLSNRMFRVYGPHRFLRVSYEESLPKHLRLAALSFAGRRWELLYVDLAKRQVVYFAVKGVGLAKEVPIEKVREWHIPLFTQEGKFTPNLDMTLSKFNARFGLGFSESIGTVVFDSVKLVPDLCSNDGPVMTDGCAAMSLWAMQQIANAARIPVLPSVVQGRMGGCKGVWYLDPSVPCPEKRPSMEKVQLPFPTLEQRRFELVEWSRDRGSASLNYQFMHVLQHLGVGTETFIALLREYASQLKNDLISRPLHFIRDTLVEGTVDSFAGRAMSMVAAGFRPDSTPYLKRLLSIAAAGKMGRLVERVRVPVKHSRWLMLVADPTGTLKFGQAYAHPSSLDAPLKGRIMVARNPCHLPSDVQVFECVVEPRLAHIRDALVLPVQGPYPMAQLLSGGDHDGDLSFISWDARLIPPAGGPERMPPPSLPKPPSASPSSSSSASSSGDSSSAIGTRSIRELVKACSNSQEAHASITTSMVEMFRGFSSTLGILTQIHAAIAEKEGVGSSNAVKAGWLCREAVDSPKSSGTKVRVPRSLQSVAGLLPRDMVCAAVREEGAKLKTSFEESFPGGAAADPDLILGFSEEEAVFAREQHVAWRHAVHEALDLGVGVEAVKKDFRRRFLAFGPAERRLFLASAFYVNGADSSNDTFAFSVCFRELLRIKADAVENEKETGSIGLSVTAPFAFPATKRENE